MAMNSVEAVINHSLTISNMIADEREQARTESKVQASKLCGRGWVHRVRHWRTLHSR